MEDFFVPGALDDFDKAAAPPPEPAAASSSGSGAAEKVSTKTTLLNESCINLSAVRFSDSVSISKHSSCSQGFVL